MLEFVGTVRVPATTDGFDPREKFVVNTRHSAPVKISKIFRKFKQWFLSGDGKIEGPTGGQPVSIHRLKRSSFDGPIFDELGDYDGFHTNLLEVFSLMERQGKGEEGILLTNGLPNVFYIKDEIGVTRAVRVAWWRCDEGWCVDAECIGRSIRWDDGSQVFSHSSARESSEILVFVA